MSNDTKVYDADQVTVLVAGVPITSGYADGEFCTVEQETEDFMDVVGTDGEVTRSKTNDRRATITIKLMQSSDGNALLSALNNLDKFGTGGAGIGPLLIKDRQGTSVYSSAKCWISKPPSVTFDRDAKERTWTIRCSNLIRFDGGN